MELGKDKYRKTRFVSYQKKQNEGNEKEDLQIGVRKRVKIFLRKRLEMRKTWS